jgi:hypothetical protein
MAAKISESIPCTSGVEVRHPSLGQYATVFGAGVGDGVCVGGTGVAVGGSGVVVGGTGVKVGGTGVGVAAAPHPTNRSIIKIARITC